ncbi:MAG: Fic family protein [Myxococcota bacterium]
MGLRDSFRDVDDRTEDLREIAGQHPDIWTDFIGQYDLSWLYHENALEGVVLTHAELSSALRGRPLAPETYADIRNLRVAVDAIRRSADDMEPITLELVGRIHSLLSTGREPDGTDFPEAAYRKDIPLHRAYFHEIAQPDTIRGRFESLLAWAAENDPEDDDAVRFAAHFHHEFMRIFPFTKHSGKTGRLLVNYILLRHGYMPVVFHATERQRYYDTLRLAKKDMEAMLTDMMTNCVENGLRYIRHVLEERSKKPAAEAV